jgi:hypothetical protein
MSFSTRLIVVVLHILSGSFVHCHAEPVPVTVTIDVVDSNGAPVVDVCVLAGDSDRVYGRTDAAGRAVLTPRVDLSAPAGGFQVSLSGRIQTGPYPELWQDRVKVKSVASASYYQLPGWISTASGATSYSHSFIGRPTTKVKGVLQWSDGSPAWAEVSGEDPIFGEDSSTLDGSFEVQGYERGRACVIIAWMNADERVVFWQLTAADMGVSEVDLGTKTVELGAGNCEVAITVTGRDAIDVCLPKDSNRGQEVALIATDLSRGYRLAVLPDGRGVDRESGNAKVRPGEYVVIPGRLFGKCVARKVLSLLSQGRAADLAAAGVPKVTVNESDTSLAVTADLGVVEAAVMGIP